MIFPRSARSWTAAGRDLVDAAPVRVHNGASRRARTLIQGIRNPIIVLIGLAQERKRRVKGARTDDVSPDAQPVRGKIVIPGPALQVGERYAGNDNWLGRGQPQKIAAAQLHLARVRS